MKRRGRQRDIKGEMIELSRLRAPEPADGGDGEPVVPALDTGVTTDLPRIVASAPAAPEPAPPESPGRPRRQAAPPRLDVTPPAPLTDEERRRRRAAARKPARPARDWSATRERVADWLLMLAAAVLCVSLFLPWSHQFSVSLLARYGASPVLRGVPRNPDAWQVYSIVDALLVLLAAALVIAALAGGRSARMVLCGFVLIALAFTVHALRVAPTNGANIVNTAVSPAGYLRNSPRPGGGEEVALAALALALLGISLSVISPRRRG